MPYTMRTRVSEVGSQDTRKGYGPLEKDEEEGKKEDRHGTNDGRATSIWPQESKSISSVYLRGISLHTPVETGVALK